MNELIVLQLTIFSILLAGFIVRKIGIVSEEGQASITDLVIYVILPCNIVKSFMVEFSIDTLYNFLSILVISILIQFGCVFLGKVLYKKKSENKRKCLQYGVICSNAGFLGNPVAEGVFGSIALPMASIYLIPQRIMMWSAGLATFSGITDKKAVWKKVSTHPCILACVIGLFLMLSQVQLPVFLTKSITTISNCNTALSMMVIGMILSEINLKTMFDKEVLLYAVVRLLVIPFLVYVPCRLLQLDHLVTGVSVLLAAMPAGATTGILAAKYEADAPFATKLVVFSTLMSLFTTAAWSYLLI